jgi:hypothetical protein
MKIGVESECFIKGMNDAYNLFIELYIMIGIDGRPQLVSQLPNHM